jgi:hypothetical protein
MDAPSVAIMMATFGRRSNGGSEVDETLADAAFQSRTRRAVVGTGDGFPLRERVSPFGSDLSHRVGSAIAPYSAAPDPSDSSDVANGSPASGVG